MFGPIFGAKKINLCLSSADRTGGMHFYFCTCISIRFIPQWPVIDFSRPRVSSFTNAPYLSLILYFKKAVLHTDLTTSSGNLISFILVPHSLMLFVASKEKSHILLGRCTILFFPSFKRGLWRRRPILWIRRSQA